SQKINEDMLEKYELPGFHKNCLKRDFNKETLDYIFAKKTDYLIIDTLNSRLNLLEKDGHTVAFTNRLFVDPVNREKLMHDFGLEDYKLKSAYDDIGDDEWTACYERLFAEILKYYTKNQIILLEFYGIEKYLIKDKTRIEIFPSSLIDDAKRYNSLAKKLNEMIKTVFAGIHVVEFPENVLSIEGHRWGTYPLHYMDEYYEYSAKAIGIITRRLPEQEEKAKISELRGFYSKIFGLYKERAQAGTDLHQVDMYRNYALNAFNFAKAVALDAFGENIFEKNLIRIKELKMRVVVLKQQNAAAEILLAALDKSHIDVNYKTDKWAVSQFSDEEKELFRQSDMIIIDAEVHVPPPARTKRVQYRACLRLVEKRLRYLPKFG
ncbi:MAG: DUF6270 domain-containing protein, partial [Ruminococcus sp.]|nr:DUF6270 domain-containing protein [Ruminococcus sp.]